MRLNACACMLVDMPTPMPTLHAHVINNAATHNC